MISGWRKSIILGPETRWTILTPEGVCRGRWRSKITAERKLNSNIDSYRILHENYHNYEDYEEILHWLEECKVIEVKINNE
jgi:hypothetical protein